jgi:crotonobetainyl-CoA:carnitine CoA-transferase CaiB-like acyl-CoA transferase
MTSSSRGAEPNPAALGGIRVVDFSRVLAGPYATMMLADLGADVIKVESPDGDETRAWLPPTDAAGRSTYFASVNRNKRSITLDLTTAGGAAEARRLALGADVLVENFRPGVMERFGLGFDELAATNPGLIYCSITGFGTGPGATLPGFDLLVQAVGGLMSLSGEPDGPPMKVGVALVDVVTGLGALSGILAALHARERLGRGQRVELNLLSSLLSALVNQASGALATGADPARLGNAHPSIAPYELVPAADRDFVLAVGNDRQFAALVAALDLADLATDARFATNTDRVRNRALLRTLLDARLAGRTAAEWVALLQEAGVPAGPVNGIGEALALAERLELGPVVNIPSAAGPSRQVANPIGLSRTPVSYRLAPPERGEHSGAGWLDRRGEPGAIRRW